MAMLLTREEMSFDWRGAKLDPTRDREILEWIFNQFLYGEMTGIQIGHWLYDAPDLEAARFLSRQALEEFQHVGNFVRIMELLGLRAKKPHAAVRFLATGMMGESWAEHVALEMAAGEGFVLMAMYGLIDTLEHAEVVAILERAVKQEERHVEFGESRTRQLVDGDRALARRLLGLSLVSRFAVRQVASFLTTRVPKDHPVISQLPAYLAKTLEVSELRLLRTGVLDRPLAQVSSVERARLVAEAYASKGAESAWALVTKPVRWLPPFAPKRLTDTYLDDPEIRAIAER